MTTEDSISADYDLNTRSAFRRVASRGILGEIRGVLPAGDSALDEVFLRLQKYVATGAEHATV